MSKKAQYTYQIRASHGIDEKIIYSSIYYFIFKENICIINEQSFFTPFAIQTSFINAQQCVQTKGTKTLAPTTTLIIANFFSILEKIEFQKAATFSPNKPSHCLQEVSLSKYTLLPWFKTHWIEPCAYIHIFVGVFLGGLFRTFLHQFWRTNKGWNGLKD